MKLKFTVTTKPLSGTIEQIAEGGSLDLYFGKILKGDPFIYEDFTPDQILDLKKPAQEAADYANNIADHPTIIGEDFYVYRWHYDTQTYVKTDIFVKGDAFSIYRVYASIAEMEADKVNVDIGLFVLINTGSVEEEDTGKIYLRTELGFEYIVDMSGMRGFTGKTPQISIGNTLTLNPGIAARSKLSPNGFDAEGNPKFKLDFGIPKGDKLLFSDLTEEDIALLQKPALDAAAIADTATDGAVLATNNADTAAMLANNKADLANVAASSATTAAINANDKASLAEEATTGALSATKTAMEAAGNAMIHAGDAMEAAKSANEKAILANLNAALANEAATSANTAADTANEATSNLQGLVDNFQTKTGDIKDNVVAFTESTAKENINSGETSSTLFGKIKKWFSSLGSLAFKNTVTIPEVDNLQTTLNNKADSSSLSNYIPLSQKGSNSGVAELDASGKVLASQLPSYVDDVLSYNSLSNFPVPGEDGKVYIAKDTNKTYRWGGSAYVTIGTDLALGETSATAYRGDRGKVAYDYSQGKRSKADLDAALQGEINGKLNSTNPIYSGSIINNHNNYRFYQGQDTEGGYIELAEVSPFVTLSQLRINRDKSLKFNSQAVVLNNDPRLSDARPASGGESDSSNLLRIINNRPNYGSGLIINQSSVFSDSPISDIWFTYAKFLHHNQAGYFNELAFPFTGSENHPFYRRMVDGETYSWERLAFTSDIPTSLPANGGNALTVGDGGMTIIPFGGNGINFGGTGRYSTIYVGYSAAGNKPTPTEFIFGGGHGAATIKAGNFLLAGKQVATTNQIPTTLPANGGTAKYISCEDYRTIGYNPTPNQIASERVSALFSAEDVPSLDTLWYSILSLKGWTNGYYVWQLASGSSTITNEDNNLYFRNGINETWRPWKKIAFDGNAQPASDVYAWAKAASKPSYSVGEISNAAARSDLPSVFVQAAAPTSGMKKGDIWVKP